MLSFIVDAYRPSNKIKIKEIVLSILTVTILGLIEFIFLGFEVLIQLLFSKEAVVFTNIFLLVPLNLLIIPVAIKEIIYFFKVEAINNYRLFNVILTTLGAPLMLIFHFYVHHMVEGFAISTMIESEFWYIAYFEDNIIVAVMEVPAVVANLLFYLKIFVAIVFVFGSSNFSISRGFVIDGEIVKPHRAYLLYNEMENIRPNTFKYSYESFYKVKRIVDFPHKKQVNYYAIMYYVSESRNECYFAIYEHVFKNTLFWKKRKHTKSRISDIFEINQEKADEFFENLPNLPKQSEK